MNSNNNQGAYSQRNAAIVMGAKSTGGELTASASQENAPNRTVNISFAREMGDVACAGLENGSVVVKNGDSITLTATPKDGYVFVKWIGAPIAEKDTNQTVTFNVYKDCDVTAVFAAEDLNPSGGGGNAGGGGGTPEDPAQVITKPNGAKSLLRKYWWVIAIIVGYLIFKEDGQ